MVSPCTFVLECRADRVTLAAFRAAGTSLTLQQLDVETLAATSVTTTTAGWTAAIATACGALARRMKSGRVQVVVVLPASQVLLKAIALPPVSVEQRAQLLPFEVAQVVPYPLSDVVWDATVVGETIRGSEVIISAAKLDVLEPLSVAIEASGLQIAAVIPAPIATLAGFGFPPPQVSEVFLGLNLNPDAGTVVLTRAGQTLLRSFRMRREETTPPMEVASDGDDAMAGARAKLVQEVARSLLHFEWRGSPGQPTVVALAGELSAVPGLAEALSQKLGVSVSVLERPRDRNFASVRARLAPSAAEAADWLDLLGAARLAVGSHGSTASLLPPRLRARAAVKRRQPWLLAAAAMWLVAAALPGIFFLGQRRTVALERTAWQRSLAPAQAQAERNASALRRIVALQAELNAGLTEAQYRLAWKNFLGELGAVVRDFDGLWFDELDRSYGPSGQPSRIRLKGRLVVESVGAGDASDRGDDGARVAKILARLDQFTAVTALEQVRFDRGAPGLLSFEVTLVGGRGLIP